MTVPQLSFTPPTNSVFCWLTDSDASVPREIRTALLGELFATPKAVLAGVINGLILNIAALVLHAGVIFAVFAVVDIFLVIFRVRVLKFAVDAATAGQPTPTDTYLLAATCWYALLGAMAFMAMYSDIVPLQLLAIAYIVGLIGPMCARNYAAPRYALLAVMLCELPLAAGAALCEDRWMLIMVLQTPLLLYGVVAVTSRFHTMALAALRGEYDNRYRARHDPLTGLVNRLGLLEGLDAARGHFTLYFLDLDGFKAINDTFGHPVGDQVLNDVAARLRSIVRAEDIVARLGGDEFVIVASDMPPSQGTIFAERIVRSVSDLPYHIEKIGPVSVGVSVGYTCVPEDAHGNDELHQKTDAALYEAKAAGKGTHRRYRAPLLC